MRYLALLVVTLAGVATPALAADQTGYQAIAGGDLAAAEQQIATELKTYPHRPELMLNLASVYRKTGREQMARDLYRDVLARRSVAMDMPSGAVVSSHDLAKRGLDQTMAVMASR